MLFNTFTFAFFLTIVFTFYWLLQKKGVKYQNLLIFIASYVFYGWWDWRFLSLIALSSLSDFFLGLKIYNENLQSKKKFYLIISIVINLGVLGFFKYFNFFASSFQNMFSSLNINLSYTELKIILPVGISFYTFQTLSYTIDVYREKLTPTKRIISFLAFVSFFPQLVAGPIERASHLLPQFYNKRKFELDKAKDGLRQMLWGLFKKMIIADNISIIVDKIYDNPSSYSGLLLIIGLFLFSIQIYADFSGYSDIAIGVSRLFGFELKRNFRYPLFARDVGERWRNWHISLSTWFRDYLYIPMGGSRVEKWVKVRNILVMFTVSGLWHGANWTFVIWGLLNGLFFVPAMLTGRNRKYLETIAEGKKLPSIRELIQMFKTFSLIAFTYAFFRAENLEHSIVYIKGILYNSFANNFVNDVFIVANGFKLVFVIIFYISILLIFEWNSRDKEHGLEISEHSHLIRWGTYYLLVFSILTFGVYNKLAFIYFQF